MQMAVKPFLTVKPLLTVKPYWLVAAMPVLLALVACTSTVPDTGVAPPVPDRWHYAAASAPVDLPTANWWKTFGSPALDAAVMQAHNDSYDIAGAVARVEQARAQAAIAGAGLWPQVDLQANVGRNRTLRGEHRSSGNYNLGVQAQYEIDFWGRQRAQRDSADAGLRASIFDHDTVRLSVTAAVASAWLRCVGLRESLAIAQRNLENAERILSIVESRRRAGSASALELANQRGLVAAQRRQMLVIDQQLAGSDIALAALLGKPVGATTPVSESLQALRNPAIGAGLPSTLLLRRPDIARAEARLSAASADVQAARAAMFPQISLVAGVSAASTHRDNLFDQPLATLGAELLAPLFSGGRLAAQRDLALAQQQELVAGYRASIVAALADVEAALNAHVSIEQQQVVQQEEVLQAREAAAIAEARYRAGAEDLLVVLDAQRTLYAAQEQQAELQTARLLLSVDLYRALGGGWQASEESGQLHP